MSTIALADRVLFLMKGRIEADGTHRELLAHPTYRAMLRAFDGGAWGGSSLVRSAES